MITSQSHQDIDFQSNNSAVYVKWYGFHHDDQEVSYAVGLGSQPLKQTVSTTSHDIRGQDSVSSAGATVARIPVLSTPQTARTSSSSASLRSVWTKSSW